MGKRAALAGGAALLGAVAWLPLTSAALHAAVPWASPPSLSVPAPAFYYWRDYRTHPAMRRWLPPCAVGTGALALMPAGLVLFVRRRRRLRPAEPGEHPPPPVRAYSSTYGCDDWMRAEEAARRFPGGAPEYGGIVIGQLGEGPDAPLLIDPCDGEGDATHGFMVGGAGAGKTAGPVVMSLDPKTGWWASVVVFDPSCRISGLTAGMRIGAGQRVIVLGAGEGRQGMNVLDWIDPDDPMAETHVESIIDTIGPERKEPPKGDNVMFLIQGRNIQLCLLADLIWSPEITRGDESGHEREVTLRRFAARMSTQEVTMRRLLEEIQSEAGGRASRSPMARRLARTLMGIHPKTFSSIYANAQSDISWLYTGVHADLVSNDDVRTDALADGNTTIYVEIPMSTLIGQPQVGRTVMNALFQSIYRKDGNIRGRVLFLLDEVTLLGRMHALEVARDMGRKYRITLVSIWQSLGQITDIWGAGGKQKWMSSAAWHWFAAIGDSHTAKEVSDLCGTYTGIAQNESTSKGSSSGSMGASNRNQSAGLSEVSVPLIRPSALRKMPPTERIVFRLGAPPLRCNAALWFKRPEMVAKIESACGLYVAAREDA